MLLNRILNWLEYGVILAAVMALLSSGCVDQQKEVGIYRAALKGHAPTTTRPAAVSFESDTKLSLTEAMALASRDNEQLALGGEEYLPADGEPGAGLFPAGVVRQKRPNGPHESGPSEEVRAKSRL